MRYLILNEEDDTEDTIADRIPTIEEELEEIESITEES